MFSACNGVGVVVDQLHARFVVNLIERPPIWKMQPSENLGNQSNLMEASFVLLCGSKSWRISWIQVPVKMCVPELETRRCCKVGFSGRQANCIGDTHAKGSGGPMQKSSHTGLIPFRLWNKEAKINMELKLIKHDRTWSNMIKHINGFKKLAFVWRFNMRPRCTSMPSVSKFSGWPGVLEPHCRNCLMSSIETLL